MDENAVPFKYIYNWFAVQIVTRHKNFKIPTILKVREKLKGDPIKHDILKRVNCPQTGSTSKNS